ncbi:MAG: hypothetical protein HY678_01845, partial [Chloroflexi bacterium]|nr:hypothetical protein [Chloroflexota bacterium]
GRNHPLFHTLGSVSRHKSFSRVLLQGLTEHEVGEVISATTGEYPPRSVTKKVYQNTEGNPFFVRELVDVLAQDGLLAKGHAAALGKGDPRLPESVREVIGRRMGRLSPQCNEAMGVAAVIGQRFDVDLLREVVALAGPRDALAPNGEHDDHLLGVIDEAVSVRIVEDVPGSPGSFRFTHALVRRALEEEIPNARRPRLHALIAEALEKLHDGGSPTQAGQIADHLAMAGASRLPEKLMRYSIVAGEQALKSLGFQEADIRFTTALRAAGRATRAVEARGDVRELREHRLALARIMEGLTRSRVWASARLESRQHAWDTLTATFKTFLDVGDTAKAVEIARIPMRLEGVRGLLEVTSRALELVEPDSVDAGYLYMRHATALLEERGDAEGARSALSDALDNARTARNLRLEVLARSNLGRVAWSDCDYKTTIEECLGSLRLSGTSDWELAGPALYHVIPAMISIGDLDRAGELADTYVKLTAPVPYYGLLPPWHAWTVAAARGDRPAMRAARGLLAGWSAEQPERVSAFLETWEQFTYDGIGPASAILERAYEVERGYFFWEAAIGLLGPIARAGADSEFLQRTEELARELIAKMPAPLLRYVRPAQQVLGFVAVARNDPTMAAELYPEVLHARASFERHAGFSVDRLLGLLAATSGDVAASRRHFSQAVAFCERTRALPELCWARHDYAALLLMSGRKKELPRAAFLVTKGAQTAAALNMKPLINRLAAMEEQIRNQWAQPSRPHGLTGREAEVLRLIASGHTNKQISDSLLITPNTVYHHVARIYGKIGVSRRAEAVSYAHRHGFAD